MRPQVGKRARNMEKKPPGKPKTKARHFIESRMKHSIALKDDYLLMKDVAVAMNMNALEQRMITKRKILKNLEEGMPRDALIEMLEKEIDMERHRLVKYGKLM